MKKQFFIILMISVLCGALTTCKKGTVYKTLIITGQSQHNWKTSSEAVKQILDETGMFSSEIMITPSKGENMSGFIPDFSKYKLVVFDYDGDPWSEKTNAALTDYLNNGGGIVVFNTKSDPGGAVSDSITVSKRHSFEIRTLITDHPVTKGLPIRWMHPDDEIVQGLKVAGEDVQVLAAAFSDTSFSGTGRFEPVLVARNYGKGRIFATLLGTPDENENQALHCTGFIVTLQRGAEWAATGSVTQEVPYDFPTAAGTVLRPDFNAITLDEAFANIVNYDIPKSTKYYTLIQSQIRKAAGDEKALLNLEKKMVSVLNNKEATVEAKKLMLRELSWMGTDYCVPSIKNLSTVPELKDEVDFALNRLK